MAKSCILTVIKNEHEYLDEWIKYHLDLGIGHIFILEDIDSDSHKEICDKYGDKVSLNSVLSILDETQRKEAKLVKELNKYSVQHMYFRNGLNMLKEKYSDVYDWCFLIDNDEFITLENDTLEDVLSQFNGYEAFVMSWKCYGANGLIHKPNKGVVESFTTEAEGKMPNQVKTCYKLKSYRKEFLYTHHHPTEKCNWCNTDFVKQYHNATYNKLYLRHYITKSWEEYVWKRKVRGYVWGRERDFDYFFKINPDMLSQKDELLKEIKNDTLVVLPYKQSSSQGNEIRIALNGWRKFCQFNYRFVVIGEFDESLKKEFHWVKFIECPAKERKEGQYNPHLDIQNKFKAIARLYAQEYDGFIYMTDDEYAVKPFDLSDITRIYYHNKTFFGNEKCPKSFWNYDKWKTRQLLDREGLPHINYTTHYPCYFEFKKMDEIRKKYNLCEESYVFDDVYFNYFEHEEPVLDCEIRLGIWNKEIFERDFQKAVENPKIKFMCNSVEGWSKDLEDNLMKIVN